MVTLHAALAVIVLSGSGQTQMLDFYADWCGPCRAMDSSVHDLMARGYPVRRVNIDHEPALAAQYGVQNIPCFIMLVDGQVADRVVGETSYGRLEQMCKLGAGPVLPTRPSLLAQIAPRLVPVPLRPSAPSPPPGPAWAPHGNAASSDAALLAASVRLRVEDPDGHSCGTGTIIDAREGEALVLTCAHIFRDSQGKGRIEVDLFGPGAARGIPARLISYNLQRDVGLVSIHTSGPVAAAHVAPAGYPIRQGERVVSVGCNNGNPPTAQHSHVTSLDKFLGPPNIQVAGQPVEGRSGGGLFSSDGLVIGVCNAADRSDREGLFAALGSLHAQLDQAGLAYIYKPRPAAIHEGNTPATAVAAVPQAMPLANVAQSVRTTTPLVEVAPGPTAVASGETGRLPPHAQAGMEELRRRLKEGAEIVCVIRNSHDPQAKSEVLMLDRGSATHEETALEVARPRRPLLEWDATAGWLHQEAIPGARD
ncbi:MAG: trypsin-like peptidase domain-containing protein [Thermoguttaceae bacterium]|jgi:thiol-disulfide isomerase/thioredoxin